MLVSDVRSKVNMFRGLGLSAIQYVRNIRSIDLAGLSPGQCTVNIYGCTFENELITSYLAHGSTHTEEVKREVVAPLRTAGGCVHKLVLGTQMSPAR